MEEAKDTDLDISHVNAQLKKEEKDLVRGQVLKTRKRIDGRGLSKIRHIVSEGDILERNTQTKIK